MQKLNLVLTGSLGNIGKPLTKQLVTEGHSVKVISSNSARSKEISVLGATPVIGKLQDTGFLTSTFKGSDVVYTMVPPPNYFDHSLDLPGYYQELGKSFAQAIDRAGVKQVVNMSSIGAHLVKGNGILRNTHYVENALNKLSESVAVTHIRPTEIYNNLFQFVHLIKSQGIIANNCNRSDLNLWVSTQDIAAAVAEEMSKPSSGRNVRYVASEELTYKQVADILGSAIGKPDLKWVTITNDEMKESLINIGMQPAIANEMVEMYSAISSGLLYEHYHLNKPDTFGEVKMKDFAQDFAAAYEKA